MYTIINSNHVHYSDIGKYILLPDTQGGITYIVILFILLICFTGRSLLNKDIIEVDIIYSTFNYNIILL